MTDCCTYLEPCHNQECDGFNEVLDLLPKGILWDPTRPSTYGKYVQALGHIKTEINIAICQELVEWDPCRAKRLFSFWAEMFKLPDCVDQTPEKLCEWLGIIYDKKCPIGSIGFLRKAIDFVDQDNNIQIRSNPRDFQAPCWCPSDRVCVDNNSIVFTAPPEEYAYYVNKLDRPSNAQDGIDPCKFYFLPAVECLRCCVLPFGLTIGYETDPRSPDGYPIYNVPEENVADRPECNVICREECNA